MEPETRVMSTGLFLLPRQDVRDCAMRELLVVPSADLRFVEELRDLM